MRPIYTARFGSAAGQPVIAGQAYLNTWTEAQADHAQKIPQAVATTYQALANGRANDNKLARLDDVAKTSSVATIAALGGINPWIATPNILGAAAWLGSMTLNRELVNIPVQLKTGLNLDTAYTSSENERRRLFVDPQYQPINILGPTRLNAMADRFNIPANATDRMGLLDAKVRQIQVQANTWWMLMTGLGTPMLAALMCDKAEQVLHYKSGIGMVRDRWTDWSLRRQANAGINPAALAKTAQKRVHAVLGQGTDLTRMAQWWTHTPGKLIGALGPIPNNVLYADSERALNLHTFSQFLAKHLNNNQTRQTLQRILTQQEKQLNTILSPLGKQITALKNAGKLGPETAEKLLQQIYLEHASATGTLDSLKHLLTLRSAEDIQTHLTDTTISNVYQALQTGRYSLAAKLAATPIMSEKFGQLVQQTNANLNPPFYTAFNDAFKALGQTGEGFFGKALKSRYLHRQWLLKFPALVGGFMALSTAIYIGVFLGHGMKAQSPTVKGQNA